MQAKNKELFWLERWDGSRGLSQKKESYQQGLLPSRGRAAHPGTVCRGADIRTYKHTWLCSRTCTACASFSHSSGSSYRETPCSNLLAQNKTWLQHDCKEAVCPGVPWPGVPWLTGALALGPAASRCLTPCSPQPGSGSGKDGRGVSEAIVLPVAVPSLCWCTRGVKLLLESSRVTLLHGTCRGLSWRRGLGAEQLVGRPSNSSRSWLFCHSCWRTPFSEGHWCSPQQTGISFDTKPLGLQEQISRAAPAKVQRIHQEEDHQWCSWLLFTCHPYHK